MCTWLQIRANSTCSNEQEGTRSNDQESNETDLVGPPLSRNLIIILMAIKSAVILIIMITLSSTTIMITNTTKIIKLVLAGLERGFGVVQGQ